MSKVETTIDTAAVLGGKTFDKVMAEAEQHATESWAAQRDPSCPIEPMPGHIVVKPTYNEDITYDAGTNLFLVSLAGEKEKPSFAPIVAIGDNTDDDKIGFTFELGDIVIFSIHAGMRVSFGKRGEEKYLVLKASVIIGRMVQVDAKPSIPTDHD